MTGKLLVDECGRAGWSWDRLVSEYPGIKDYKDYFKDVISC